VVRLRPVRLVLALIVAGLSGCGQPDPAATANTPKRPPFSADPRPVAESAKAGEPQKKKKHVVGDRLAGVTLTSASTISKDPSPFRFEDIQPTSGVDFHNVSGLTVEKHFPTANGSGLAIFDADGDGRMDLYFASFNDIQPGKPMRGKNRMYRNRGDGTFEDVTDASGLGFVGWCHGVIACDLDNDGDQDMVLCNYGPNVVYRNDGKGVFEDVTAGSGMDRPGWSSGGAPIDYDNDGDLDLYISNYGEWTYPDDDVFCGDQDENIRMYCSPRMIRTAQHFLYRNDGNFKFTDATEAAGVARGKDEQGHGFGVVTADLNGDGKIDIYVANDMNPNFLFLNQGDGTFRDATEESGSAYDDKGNAQSGMAVDATDFDGDGRPDLFVTNFANEYNTLYQNLGNGSFYDMTNFVGLGADSMPWVGWGCGLVDLDNDSWPDAFVGNGHVDDNREGSPYQQLPLLHRNVPLGIGNDAGRRFKLSTLGVGPYFEKNGHVARGVAFGDLDDDGRMDIVVNHKDAVPGLVMNRTPSALGENHWIRLKLVGTRSNRDAIGANVLTTAGGHPIFRQRKGGTSLESSHDPRMLIGMGTAPAAEKVVITWPSGAVSTLEDVKSGQTVEVIEPRDDPPAP
jgi:hypothetical protein